MGVACLEVDMGMLVAKGAALKSVTTCWDPNASCVNSTVLCFTPASTRYGMKTPRKG